MVKQCSDLLECTLFGIQAAVYKLHADAHSHNGPRILFYVLHMLRSRENRIM